MATLLYRLKRPDGEAPRYATNGAAGLDLTMVAWAYPDEPGEAFVRDLELDPGERALVLTGLSLEIPAGHEGQVRGRSGLALRSGLMVALGTIDEDYRGEVGVILYNADEYRQTVRLGERVAQLVIAPIVRCELKEVGALSETPRGEGGFGSSGRGQVMPTLDGLVMKLSG